MMIFVIAVLFTFMVLLPIIGSTWYYKSKESDVLFINQDKTRDPRYFGKSFSKSIKKGLDTVSSGKIQLSKMEEVIEAEKQGGFEESVDKLVIAKKDLTVPSNCKFRKEIYGAENIEINGDGILRAAYSDKNMVVGSRTTVRRWIDANGTLAVYDDCNLGTSVTSKERISIGKGCTFHRAFAPQICFGQYPGALGTSVDKSGKKYYPVRERVENFKNAKYISKENGDDDGIIHSSVVTWRNLSITENIIVRGDIRTQKGIRLCEGAVVCGNIFAEKDVMLDKNTCVMGSIFTQGDVYMKEGATVGKKGAISSLIARGKIEIESGCFIYGDISSEKGGIVLKKEGEETFAGEYTYLEAIDFPKTLSFDSLDEYENVDIQGYRHYEHLEEVVIPEGAKNIPDSMFFGCTGLKKVVIPKSVESIGAYTFARCTQLEELQIEEESALCEIGEQCFWECENLAATQIPGLNKKVETEE